MAKQTEGITGGYRGSVGPVVGYMWRGQWCVRAKPRFFHDAKTEKQLEQRSVFKASVAFAGRVKEVLRTGFCKPALEAHKTECNYFLKINKGCFAMDGEVLLVDYENLRVSEGPVAPVGFGSAEVVDERTLVIPFEKNPEHRRANGDDRVFVALFCAATGEASLSLPHASPHGDAAGGLGRGGGAPLRLCAGPRGPHLGERLPRRWDAGGVCC